MTEEATILVTITCMSAIAFGLVIGSGKLIYTAVSFFFGSILAIVTECLVWDFDYRHDIITNTQIAEVTLVIVSIYSIVLLLTILLANRIKNQKLKLRFKITKPAILFFIVGFLLPLTHLFVGTYFYRIVELFPEMDIQVPNDQEFENEIATTEKGFGIEGLKNVSLFKNDVILRVYRMPSFDREQLLEIKLLNGKYSVTQYEPIGKSIWDDRQVITSGGGSVLDENSYKPSISISKTTFSKCDMTDEILTQIIMNDGLKMKSMSRGSILTREPNIYFDGQAFYVTVKKGNVYNAFHVSDEKYADDRYNWIITRIWSICTK